MTDPIYSFMSVEKVLYGYIVDLHNFMATVRSHYLPRTYLKYFFYEDTIFVYKKGKKFFDEKTKPEDRILEVRGEDGLSNIGVEKHFYDPEMEGIDSDDLEEIFQELGENTYDATIAAVRTLPNSSHVPPDIKDPLCLLMASMRVRTPLFKKEIEEMDEQMRKHLMAANYERMSVEEVMQHAKEATGEEITAEFAAEIKKSFVNKRYALKYPNAYFIKFALLLVKEHINIFHQMRMTVYRSNGRFFITNDNPLVYFVPPEHVNVYNPPKGLVTPHCEVFFPLAKDLAVHLTWRKMEENLISTNREIVDRFNYNLSRNSLDYIFSPMKVNELEKFTQEHIPYPFKFTVH